LNKLILENLISSLKSHEIELVEDEPSKESKSIGLKSKEKSAKALQASESEEETPNGGSDNDSYVEEMTYLTKRFQCLTKSKSFQKGAVSQKGQVSRTGEKIIMDASIARNLVTLLLTD
jgi:hypothetical protein